MLTRTVLGCGYKPDDTVCHLQGNGLGEMLKALGARWESVGYQST